VRAGIIVRAQRADAVVYRPLKLDVRAHVAPVSIVSHGDTAKGGCCTLRTSARYALVSVYFCPFLLPQLRD
jgi:hypothetical protein